MVSGQKATVVTLVNMFGLFKRGHSNSDQRWSKWKWSMCVRSDHRGRSRSVNNVSKVVRVLKWSKVVNDQKATVVTLVNMFGLFKRGHSNSGQSGSGQCVSTVIPEVEVEA